MSALLPITRNMDGAQGYFVEKGIAFPAASGNIG